MIRTMDPTIDRFRALARSSPWRWQTLRFTAEGVAPAPDGGGVRAWVRRPDSLRVEQLDGTLLQAGVRRRGPRSQAVLSHTGRGGHQQPPRLAEVEPALDADRLVAQRPAGAFAAGDPMFGDYVWVALLDPVELADGRGPDGVRPAREPGAELAEVTAVEHHGRQAWEALLRPAPTYEPRCSCCPLLGGDGDGDGTHRVRLDVATGVCVLVEPSNRPGGAAVTELVIEAVDEAMEDDLFETPRRGLLDRLRLRLRGG
jgi:hypothetical protein